MVRVLGGALWGRAARYFEFAIVEAEACRRVNIRPSGEPVPCAKERAPFREQVSSRRSAHVVTDGESYASEDAVPPRLETTPPRKVLLRERDAHGVQSHRQGRLVRRALSLHPMRREVRRLRIRGQPRRYLHGRRAHV